MDEVLVAPQPGNPDIRIARHSDAKAFLIAPIPDYMGEGAVCSKQTRGESLVFQEPREKVYGNYYAIGFRMATSAEDSGLHGPSGTSGMATGK